MTAPATALPLTCIGLMSGTSMDGVDGVLVDISPASGGALSLRQRGFASVDLPVVLRDELLALNTPGDNELHRGALAANALMRVYAQCVQQLCAEAAVAPEAVAVVGAHGQTVRHRPGLFDGTGYTTQLINGALLAELTGIAVACDFRSRDVAAGGQGAPLVPVFHQAVWNDSGETLVVLNLGGIANLSVLAPGKTPFGFDCGPANALLDGWCQQHTGQPYDADGRWAAQGQVHVALLQQLMAEPYIRQAPPKSTGRDLFNAEWLQQQLALQPGIAAVDVQATLTAYTVQAAAHHARAHAPAATRLLVCGGGVRNGEITRQLAEALPGVTMESTRAHGIDPQAVEATAFAWLASKTWLREPIDMTAVTGAKGPRVLGCLYPA